MHDSKDFSDPIHRTQSASAVFQRGVYHLFILERQTDCDMYANVIRSYQVTFQLCLTILLLDFTYTLRTNTVSRRLKACGTDGDAPTCAEIDPAAIVTHSIFEKRKWPGPPHGSLLQEVGLSALDLIQRTVEARHNLIYRPFLFNRDGLKWEDCSLLKLLGDVSKPAEIHAVYRKFMDAVLRQRVIEIHEQEDLYHLMEASVEEWRTHLAQSKQNWADYFIQLQFWPYVTSGASS